MRYFEIIADLSWSWATVVAILPSRQERAGTHTNFNRLVEIELTIPQRIVASTPTGGAMDTTTKSSQTRAMPSILDKELGEQAKDAFGHQHYADMLMNLIESKHRPPYSIGLLGSWGTGKSSIKELYLSSLKNDNTGPKGARRRDRIHTISFNAWRHGGEQDIKRALLRDAYQQLGGDDEILHRHLHNQITNVASIKRNWWEWIKEALMQNATSAALFLLIFGICLGALVLTSTFLGTTSSWTIPAVVVAASTVAIFLCKYVVDLRLRSPSLFSPQTTITFPATRTEEYERLLVTQIQAFRKENKSCTRLVVFVDDLDRLSAAEMVAGLDAIRTFLELSLKVDGDDFGVIFVISCDEDRIADALSRGRGKTNPDLPATVVTRSDARRYLDRLFQFRLEIPPFPKVDMRKFAEQKLNEAGTTVDDLASKGVRLDDLVDKLIHPGVQSPRNAIQILNAFLQSWWIASLREKNGNGSLSAGALHAGAVTGHPLALAALSVIKVDFPDFYNALQKRPELIQDFNAAVFRNEDTSSLSLGAQIALRDFLLPTENGTLTNDVKPDSRPLRQYLSSLQGLRWPKHMQPLLLMAEDSLSGKFGDGAVELNAAFVSGDTKGVLEVLGHHLDTADLSVEDVRLLEQLVEDSADETTARKINKARVIADLARRIPRDLRPGLLVPLARDLVAFRELRVSVRPSGAQFLLGSIGAEDSRDLAGAFGKDLLTGEVLDFPLRSGEAPNIDELTTDVLDAVQLVLDIRDAHGLGQVTANLLRNWLLKRDVRSKEGSQTIGFNRLESFVAKYSDLLTLLSSDYVDLVIAELDAANPSVDDLEKVLVDVRSLHERMFAEGQQSREIAWRQLARIGKAKNMDAVTSGWKTAGDHTGAATPEQAVAFLSAIAERLTGGMNERPKVSPTWQPGAVAFLDLLTAWEGNVQFGSILSMIPLLKAWSGHDACAPFMIRAAEIVRRRNPGLWSTLADQLLTASLQGLPSTIVAYLANHAQEFTNEQRSIWIGKLGEVINAATINEKASQNYAKAIEQMPRPVWSNPDYQGHAQQLVARLLVMYNNKEFIEAYFPSARSLLDTLPPQAAGTFLNSIFEQAYGAPLAYAALHQRMIGHWPERNDQIGQYNTDQIVSRGAQFVRSHVADYNVATGSVFRSTVDLYARKLATANTGPELAASAIALWPTDPQAILDTVEQLRTEYSAATIVSILTGSQPQDGRAQEFADIVAKSASDDDWMEVSNLLLAQQPNALNGMPDGALSVWLSALEGRAAKGLRRLLAVDTRNDDQKDRLIHQALQRMPELGFEFFSEEIAALIVNTAGPKSSATLYGHLDQIVGLASNGDERSLLSSKLIGILPLVPTDRIAKLSSIIKALGGKSRLERASETIDKLDESQLELVIKEFSDSKLLRKALEALQESKNEM